MFESRLAPAADAVVHRDLSSFEIWEVSLTRSRRRRELAERQRKAAPKTKGTAAAMSAALLVSPVLPIASAGAQSGGAGPASAPPIPRPDVGGAIVERGDVGETVAAVQRRVGVDDDRVFGPVTQGAVRDFQARSGLSRTGVVDVATWRALFRASVSFVRPDSAVAKRIVAQLPQRPTVPKRQDGRGGGQTTAGNGSQSPARAAAAPPPSSSSPAAGDACGGKVASPLRGTVTSRFGDGRNHQGIDIAAPVGTAVRAAACGTVSLAGSQNGYGNIICIQHSSSFSTCYAHLSQMSVRQGAYVHVGQVIGRVGMTGRTTGPHLHFETRINGRQQDPAPYLSRAKSMPGQSKARTSRAATAPKTTGSTRAVASRSTVSAAAPAQQDARVAVQQQAQAPQGVSPPATATAAQQRAPEPAPAAAQAPEPAPPAARAAESAQAAAQVPLPPRAAAPAPQESSPAPAEPASAPSPPAAETAPATPASPSTVDAKPAPEPAPTAE